MTALTGGKDENVKYIEKGNNMMNNKGNIKIGSKSKIVSEDQPFVTPSSIDKIAVIVNMPDAAIHGCFNSGVLSRCEEDPSVFEKRHGSARYPLKVQIACPTVDGEFQKDGPTLLLQSTKKEAGKPQVRLEFNPNKLFGRMVGLAPSAPEAPIDFLDNFFQEICGVDYFEFLSHGHVSAIDICREILWRDLERYLFYKKKAMTAQNVFGKNGLLQTMYFGQRTGNQTKVYNKAKERHGDTCPYDVIRIEVALRTKVLPIQNLWSLANPFASMQVLSTAGLKVLSPVGYRRAFADSCRYRGVGKAIQCQPQSMRGKLKKAIASSPVDWWQMQDEDWENRWHEALADVCFDRIPAHAPKLTTKNLCGEG